MFATDIINERMFVEQIIKVVQLIVTVSVYTNELFDEMSHIIIHRAF